MYHGGDPVLHGTRYIIAAFLLLDAYEIQDEDEEEREKGKDDLDIAHVNQDNIKEYLQSLLTSTLHMPCYFDTSHSSSIDTSATAVASTATSSFINTKGANTAFSFGFGL